MVPMGQWLDLTILAFFFNLNDSVIDPEPSGGGAGFVLESPPMAHPVLGMSGAGMMPLKLIHMWLSYCCCGNVNAEILA